VHWDNPTPVVAALIEVDGRVLLARNKTWPAKMFALVTGVLERDESPLQAVEREVAEETALATRAAALIGVYSSRAKISHRRVPWGRRIGSVKAGRVPADRTARLRPNR
jgi:ADP-ribose pyrophosphatase YjhB (NUDIX family)